MYLVDKNCIMSIKLFFPTTSLQTCNHKLTSKKGK